MALMLLLSGPRLAYRYFKDHGLDFRERTTRKRVLILGAGTAGEMLARDLRRESQYLPVGFLDDEPRLRGARVRGIPVLGEITDIALAVKRTQPDILIIAMPSAGSRQMRRVVEACEQTGVEFRTLPKLSDMVEGRSVFTALRQVDIQDLLGRAPVPSDWENMSERISGKTVLVTGGGGSIGSELCRQLARIGPTAIVVLEHSEFNLYEIERELKTRFPDLHVFPVLGDVCETAAVERVFRKYAPQIVFHAAAYKHVPLLEDHIRAAVRNNVMGTRCVADLADRYDAESFVLISTDKAVNPVNIMGATKRLAELYCNGLGSQSNTRFVTVRFGNVLGSAGSVVPLFRKQIESGGPVTVTHPDITRFFMTIPEACTLILQSEVLGDGGETFVLDMGEPVRIKYLAQQMIRLAGKEPGEDIEITYTGLRPGEKLFEELFYDQEDHRQTSHPKIFLARQQSLDWHTLRSDLPQLEQAVRQFDVKQTSKLLQELVPELQPALKTPSDTIVAMHAERS
jgi:FlaA1/EpsC-like NDP-sugar epimerase